MVEDVAKRLFIQDPSWVDYFDLLDTEYANLIKTLSTIGHCEVTNCWERDNPGGERCLTVGEVEVDENGKKQAKESFMTLPIDQKSENCLDFIFEI